MDLPRLLVLEGSYRNEDASKFHKQGRNSLVKLNFFVKFGDVLLKRAVSSTHRVVGLASQLSDVESCIITAHLFERY